MKVVRHKKLTVVSCAAAVIVHSMIGHEITAVIPSYRACSFPVSVISQMWLAVACLIVSSQKRPAIAVKVHVALRLSVRSILLHSHPELGTQCSPPKQVVSRVLHNVRCTEVRSGSSRPHRMFSTSRILHHTLTAKIQTIPITSNEGLYGCELFGILHCLDNRLTNRGEVFSFKHRPRTAPNK
jgi:hypothetical protein